MGFLLGSLISLFRGHKKHHNPHTKPPVEVQEYIYPTIGTEEHPSMLQEDVPRQPRVFKPKSSFWKKPNSARLRHNTKPKALTEEDFFLIDEEPAQARN